MAHLQALLQRLFLRAEELFNAAFGEQLNPLYHLGAITFFLFWLVGGSGLYLYAFFETGVSAAHASVEALTHGQWWAGGVLRSVHRYASDAMVVTMLLHLARHFAFDRFRGWRWFSWLTGVVLIWLVYVSGINGYMLPWDRLAQFVVIASFEWLDWLPAFGGSLVRNFMYASSVSDRFFSLLSFLHVGLPLAVLLLMWVHVQRVPKARTTPPRPVAIGIVAALLVLSLGQPALSQGGAADLGQAVVRIAPDWFYLALLPVIADGALATAWALTGAGTLLLATLPWWPRRRVAGIAEHTMTLAGPVGEPVQVPVRPDETLLDAGLRQGLPLPFECRNGACGVCLCSVEHGAVTHRPYQRSALPDALKQQGKALLCCAVPLQDVAVTVDAWASAVAVREFDAKVIRLERLADDVMRVWLRLPGGERLRFAAGQYLHVILADGQRRAFSFANPPHDNALIELHVRRIPGGRFTGHVFEGLRVGDTLRLEGPLGSFRLAESERPIFFVAGATGFAPVKSILEDAFKRGIRRPMRLYWGVRRPQDLYLLPLAEQWQREHPQFGVVPVVSEPQPQDHWSGRTGLVHEAMLADAPELAGVEVYVCGSVRMVESAVPALLARGLDEDACFSDAFRPAGAAV
ncbi:MAG TPA: 2Fe-2S iron-sulfur cluster-binding protein [Ramlibacter sp.]|uniref:2Fe-2S iron-sulfur cluster-binding protein n=1 Tax=Ramlibacter sp. TaxID=1917967 RepID=UPI002D7E9EDA|nr:2Fe-2S iron-sulfur cluster-binding protein [Ramlibacter sp.]HET8747956.1 2Fe-2S iron-sulfur cluster-binding protein [Ramlibacter sp.]